MTNKKSNDSRRKLLKSIAAGSGAVVAGKSLPESWTKPMVDSVLLPSHAETTDSSISSAVGNPTPPPCQSTLIIPGDSVSCSDGNTERNRYFYIDDTDACPVLILATESSAPSPADLMQVRVYMDDSGGDPLWASFGLSGEKPEYETQLCTSPWEAENASYNDTFTALSGATWAAEWTLSRTDTSPIKVTVSDITLTTIA